MVRCASGAIDHARRGKEAGAGYGTPEVAGGEWPVAYRDALEEFEKEKNGTASSALRDWMQRQRADSGILREAFRLEDCSGGPGRHDRDRRDRWNPGAHHRAGP